jgi:hypothetical protein
MDPAETDPRGNGPAARLLSRLDAIGRSLERTGRALALLALGSVGRETGRLDAWSDLDFFAVVRPGEKARFVGSLDWLADAHPIAWAFRNTADGSKVLMTDGVFCEMAVFEPHELTRIPYPPGRIVWSAPDADLAFAEPVVPVPMRHDHGVDWLVGEILSNLFVGLARWHRGERLAGMRLTQVHAMDRLIDLLDQREPASDRWRDPFVRERRVEGRHPARAEQLARCAPGVEDARAGAVTLLDTVRDVLGPRTDELVPPVVDRWIRALATATPGEVVAFPGA